MGKQLLSTTDGWRGFIGDEFTFESVARVAQALAIYFRRQPRSERGILLGYDTRFLSLEAAQLTAALLVEAGLPVAFCTATVSTPSLSWAVVQREAAGAVTITASHNPPQFNGIKLKGDFGGSATPQMMAEVEALADELLPQPVPHYATAWTTAQKNPLLTTFDPLEDYCAHLGNLADLSAATSLPSGLILDAMHGSAARCMQRLFGPCADKCRFIRQEPNPGFGGVTPEPIARNLEALRQALDDWPGSMGVAVDGDGDRVGAMDESGQFVNSHIILALLLKYLAEVRGERGWVVKSISTTRMVDKLCARYELPVVEVPIGFKYISEQMRQKNALIAGEESGGIGIRGHIPERDALLAGALLVEALAHWGLTLAGAIADLFNELGLHLYDRLDIPVPREAATEVRQFVSNFDPAQVWPDLPLKVQRGDGVKATLPDGQWILLRAAGTEPLVRIYAEGHSQEQLDWLTSAWRRAISPIAPLPTNQEP